MNVTFVCPRCEQSGRQRLSGDATGLDCPHCGVHIELPAGALVDGELKRCLVCPSSDLFVRKDFPQRLGVAIVVVGFALSCLAWYNYQVLLTYAILFATAGIDLALYLLMGECLTCYRCGAQYRDVESVSGHQPFNLETHERHRQLAARMASQPPAGKPPS